MKTTTKTALIAGLLIPGAALAQISVGDALGTDADSIRDALTAQGYEVTEIEVEHDEIEVEATLDGVAMEIEVSLDTGQIVEIELDDDEDDDS